MDGVQTPESIAMTQQHTPVGWYPDPSGRHESRYFDRQWTQHVSTRGVNSIDPLTASPAPAASGSVGTPVQTPYGPAGQSGPGAPPDLHSAPGTSPRSPKAKLAIAGGVLAVAVGITLAVSLTGSGGGGGHGFCTDARALHARYGSARVMKADLLKSRSEVSYLASQFDVLAAESPSLQDAADLHLAAGAFRDIYNGNYSAFQAEQARFEAATSRVGAYLTDQCG